MPVVDVHVNFLRRVRMSLDVTIVELASASGVHRDTIRRLERFDHTPTVATVNRLAAALTFLTGEPVRFDTEGLPNSTAGFSEAKRSVNCDPLGAVATRRVRQKTCETAGTAQRLMPALRPRTVERAERAA